MSHSSVCIRGSKEVYVMKKLCCFTIAVRLADTRSLYIKTIAVQRLSAYVIPLI